MTLPEPYYDRDGITVYVGDCLDVLPALGDASVDLLLTDPPYNVSARSGRANTTVRMVPRKDGTMREIRRDFGEWDHDWNAEPFLGEVARLIRPSGSLVAFTSAALVAPYLASGLDHRGLLYWRKSNPPPNFRKQIVHAVEMAVWQTQGGGWTFNAGGYRPNVWEGPILNGYTVQNTDERRVHPTQKPLWLIREWVQLFSNPGDLIVDPFAGSLTTAVAAHQLGRRCIAIELDCEYVQAGVERLRQGVLL